MSFDYCLNSSLKLFLILIMYLHFTFFSTHFRLFLKYNTQDIEQSQIHRYFWIIYHSLTITTNYKCKIINFNYYSFVFLILFVWTTHSREYSFIKYFERRIHIFILSIINRNILIETKIIVKLTTVT